jgi:hypothetical protein
MPEKINEDIPDKISSKLGKKKGPFGPLLFSD